MGYIVSPWSSLERLVFDSFLKIQSGSDDTNVEYHTISYAYWSFFMGEDDEEDGSENNADNGDCVARQLNVLPLLRCGAAAGACFSTCNNIGNVMMGHRSSFPAVVGMQPLAAGKGRY